MIRLSSKRMAKKTVEIYIQIRKGATGKNRDTVQHTAKDAKEAVAFIEKHAK